jgi:anti-sigma-K factor RskA
VAHVDPEVVALIALGEDAGTTDDLAHLNGCAHCAQQLQAIASVVTTARQAGVPGELASPPAELWSRIAVQSGVPAGHSLAAAQEGRDQHSPAGASAGKRHGRGTWRRRPLAAAIAGVIAGVIIGLGGVAIAHFQHQQPTTHVVARFALRPLPQFPQWHTASGTAVMESGAGGLRLRVAVRAPSRPGFFEVWLLARNGVSMISLGDLDRRHTGQFTLPPGVDLHNYSRVDISLQPFNGSTAHSKISVVRGTLHN